MPPFSVLHRARDYLPSRLTNFIFQSDNAGNYQNNYLPILLPELAKSAGWVCDGILHSETQDGKCIVDAHFQKVNGAIARYVNEEEEMAATADQICTAIVFEGGLPATNIAVIRLDHTTVDQRLAQVEAVISTAKLLMPGKPLEIRYSNDPTVADTAHETSRHPSVAVQPTATATSRASKLRAILQTEPLQLSVAGLQQLHARTGKAARGTVAAAISDSEEEEEAGMEVEQQQEEEEEKEEEEEEESAATAGAGDDGESSEEEEDEYEVQAEATHEFTGVQVLRRVRMGRRQRSQKKKAVEEHDEEDDEEDMPRQRDLVSTALCIFEELVEGDASPVCIPDNFTISKHITPDCYTATGARGEARRRDALVAGSSLSNPRRSHRFLQSRSSSAGARASGMATVGASAT